MVAEVNVVRVQTDISRLQVVREMMYASVATQAGACVVLADGDTVMWGWERLVLHLLVRGCWAGAPVGA